MGLSINLQIPSRRNAREPLFGPNMDTRLSTHGGITVINCIPNNAPLAEFCFWPKEPAAEQYAGADPTRYTGALNGVSQTPIPIFDIVQHWIDTDRSAVCRKS